MTPTSSRHKMYLFVLTVMCISRVSPQEASTFYLSCGASLRFYSGSEIMLKLTQTGTYWNNIDCETVARTVTGEQLSLKLIEISLADCGDSLTLYDGSYDTVLYSHNCSSPVPVHDFTTSGTTALLKFTSNAVGNNGHFSLLMTSFRNASTIICTQTGFRCKNDRCLGADLSCNKRDNCGDNSDEANCPADEENTWWWIVLLSITGVLVVAFLIYGIKLACDQGAKERAAAKAKRNNETPAPSTSRASGSNSQSSQTNTSPQQNSPQAAAASGGTRNKNSPKKKKGSVQPLPKPSVTTSTQTDTPPSAPPSEEQVPPTTTTIFQPPGNPLAPVIVPTVQPSAPGALPMGTPVLVHVVPVPQPPIPTSQPSDEAPPSYESVMAGEQTPVTTRTNRFPPQNTNSTSPGYPPQGVYVIAVPPAEPSDTQPPAYTPPENNQK